MTTKHFKTLAIGLFSGTLGGAVSGGLLGLALGTLAALASIASGDWAAVAVMPLFSFFGAIYGLMAGITAGLVGGILLIALGAAEKAPTLGKWMGCLIGAGVAAAFPIGAALPIYDNSDWWLLMLAVPAALMGAVVGHIGGKLAGEVAARLMGVGGGDSAEIKLATN